MALAPTDAAFITAPLPPEMREGLDGTEVAPPTEIVDLDGQVASLTRIRVPRPAQLPPPSLPTPSSVPLPQPAAAPLQFAFALLPGVQCQLTLTGPATADHLEQLCEYLQVACKRIREQESRKARRTKGE